MEGDIDVISLLVKDPDKGMKVLYDDYYKYLCYAVYKVLPDQNAAEDIVQELFYDIYKKRDSLNINQSLKSYLRRAVVNRTLNYIRDKKVFFEDEEKATSIPDTVESVQQTLEASELQVEIKKAIDTLPERCRVVFGLSRFEELSYAEISERLDISIKTVENQISKALKVLRKSLKPHLLKKDLK